MFGNSILPTTRGYLDVFWYWNWLNNLGINAASRPVALYWLLGLRYHSFNLVKVILKKVKIISKLTCGGVSHFPSSAGQSQWSLFQ